MARSSKTGKWSIDPQKMAHALRIKQAQVPRVVVLELGRRIIKRTPVQHPDFIPPSSSHQSGNLKANWNYGQGFKRPQYNPAAASSAPLGVEPAETIAGLTASVGQWKMGASFSVLNGAPYAVTVERGGYPNPPLRGSYNYATGKFEIRSAGGFSKQAPAGMVRVTIGEFQTLVQKAAAQQRSNGLKV